MRDGQGSAWALRESRSDSPSDLAWRFSESDLAHPVWDDTRTALHFRMRLGVLATELLHGANSMPSRSY
jgi:hypothetical protein